MLQSLNPFKTEFAHGEAEGIVRSIRAAYRVAEEKQRAGDTRAYQNATRKANALLEAFRRRMERYLERYVKKYLAFASLEDRVDALSELQQSVLLAVKNTSGSSSAAYWERHFNKCVQCRAIDIGRTVRRHYGYTGSGHQEMSFSQLENSDGDVSGLSLEERLPDTNAEAQMEAVLSRDVLNTVIAELGEAKRHNLSLWWRQFDGETWEAIGESEKLKADTVRKRAQAVIALVRKALQV